MKEKKKDKAIVCQEMLEKVTYVTEHASILGWVIDDGHLGELECLDQKTGIPIGGREGRSLVLITTYLKWKVDRVEWEGRHESGGRGNRVSDCWLGQHTIRDVLVGHVG
jgi:hypothetical protein